MPVNRKMMKSMKEQYGKTKGEDIYYAVEQKQKKAKGYMGGGMAKKPMGYNKGGMCGASNPPSKKRV
jgi:hypothetical protein